MTHRADSAYGNVLLEIGPGMSSQLSLFESPEAMEPWTVRVSRRARRLSVRVFPGGRVEVVVPQGVSAVAVQRFVDLHRQWIQRRIEDFSTVARPSQEPRPALISLPAIARQYDVDYRRTSASVRVLTGVADTLLVQGAVQDERAVAGALRRWLVSLAEIEFSRSLRAVAQQCELPFRRVQIRRQRTRWGSCSASGTISLNVCLMFTSPAVLRYLFIHELCHTRFMNHSRHFWSLVASYEPAYRQLDRELSRAWKDVPSWMLA
ncbi:hypothetical protein ACG33_08500 [Steroidobacter denitrificans]|uniref:YgjP-like metallopeptidase domain-containing protein n=1 Tax=Steroidobacter denitrificans TaxID=465721 RepID=A0A127F9N5_STEDE|nr:SprT family zinc-dependent metalloprotease [Steroidobacter denitrificans]AMN47136.1 hypothetical protein ACG33_08500 [Steroidobacter denitrificans]